MKSVLVLALIVGVSEAQLLTALVEFLDPLYEAFSDPDYNKQRFQTPQRFPDGGTEFPQATGRDELFPSDCGRHPHDGTGKLCFPDGILCQISESFCYTNDAVWKSTCGGVLVSRKWAKHLCDVCTIQYIAQD